MTILAAVGLAAVALGGCAVAGAPDGPRPLPSPRATDGVTFLEGGPMARAVPVSGDAERGVTYRFELYSHCGLGYWAAWDFDGSFWDPWPQVSDDAMNPPDGISNPFDKGTIELIGDDLTRFTSASGIVVELRRSPDQEREGYMCV